MEDMIALTRVLQSDEAFHLCACGFNRKNHKSAAEGESCLELLLGRYAQAYRNAYDFMSHAEQTKTSWEPSGSYLFKHIIERTYNLYTPNGAAIAGALAHGIRVKRVGPNGLFGVSRRWRQSQETQRDIAVAKREGLPRYGRATRGVNF